MSRDTSFYYSFLVLPPRKRRAIIAVWDFCRAVDDAVDEVPANADACGQLAMWRVELDACYSGTGTRGNGDAATRGTEEPSTVHSLAGLRFALTFSARLNFFPPTSSP